VQLTGMISDYMDYGGGSQERYGAGEGMQPTYDVWGTVLSSSDDTKTGNVRVQVKRMKNSMDTFDNVPVLTGYGGSEYGVFFLPEEGDIVRLTFLGGDFRHPVVTGCRFPENSQYVKDTFQKDNLQKMCKVKNGSCISFSGEQGKEKIDISGPKNMEWELDEEQEQIVCGDKEHKNQVLLDKKNGKAQITSEEAIRLECGKSSLELKKDGTVVLQCEQLTLEAKTVEIKGKTKIQLKGQQLNMEGTNGVNLTANGQIKVDSKGQLKLSGAMIQLN